MNTQLVAAFFFKSTGQTRIRCAPISLEHNLKLSVQSADPRLPPLVEGMFQGYLSPLSFAQIRNATLVCLKLFKQAMRLALALARASAGSRRPAKIAIMAITTSNSMRVNAEVLRFDLIPGVFVRKLPLDGGATVPCTATATKCQFGEPRLCLSKQINMPAKAAPNLSNRPAFSFHMPRGCNSRIGSVIQTNSLV